MQFAKILSGYKTQIHIYCFYNEPHFLSLYFRKERAIQFLLDSGSNCVMINFCGESILFFYPIQRRFLVLLPKSVVLLLNEETFASLNIINFQVSISMGAKQNKNILNLKIVVSNNISPEERLNCHKPLFQFPIFTSKVLSSLSIHTQPTSAKIRVRIVVSHHKHNDLKAYCMNQSKLTLEKYNFMSQRTGWHKMTNRPLCSHHIGTVIKH